jgi:hypothetical protein
MEFVFGLVGIASAVYLARLGNRALLSLLDPDKRD